MGALIRERHPGWETALDALLESHRGELFRFCLKRLGQTQDAEDTLQETLMRAVRGIESFEWRSSLRTWLFAIADRECSSAIRRRHRHRPTREHWELLRLHEAQRLGEPCPDNLHWQVQRGQLVREALRRLPQKSQEVLSLRFYRDASLEQIARRLDISMSAAKMRLYRAVEQLAAEYPESPRQDRGDARGPLAAAA